MKPKPGLVLPQVAPVIRTSRTWNVLPKSIKFIFWNFYWCQARTRQRKSFADTQLKIAQVVTVLLVEQCLNNTVIMAKQCCSTNNVVHYCFNNVVQHWWSNNGCSRLLKQEKTILIEQACSLLLSFFVWCLRVDACLSAGCPRWLWRILVDNFVVESYLCRCFGIFCQDF